MNKFTNFKKKLSNKNGASILFALLLFLIVSLVSVTIIASANSSSKQIASNKEAIESNIALDSVVLNMKSQIDNAYRTYKNWGYTGFETENTSFNDSYYYNELNNFCNLLINNKTNVSINDFTYGFTISVTSSNTNILEDVEVSYKYKIGQDIKTSYIVFKLVSSSGNTIYTNYSLTYDDSSDFFSPIRDKHTLTFKYLGAYSDDPGL